MNKWLEEDGQVLVHPRDPYHRVDVLDSSRHVRVLVNGEVVAETDRPKLLFETSLPTCYHIPPDDIQMEMLVPREKTTQCPYKGIASYWSVGLGASAWRILSGANRSPSPKPEDQRLPVLLQRACGSQGCWRGAGEAAGAMAEGLRR